MHPERMDTLAVETGRLPRQTLLGNAAAALGLAAAGLFTSAGWMRPKRDARAGAKLYRS